MARRNQLGTVVQRGSSWYVRYYETRFVDGAAVRKKISKRLGPVLPSGSKPSAAILRERDRWMATVNFSQTDPDRIVTVAEFVERFYLPSKVKHSRPSTSTGYRNIWTRYLQPLCGDRVLRDVSTYNVQLWFDQIGSRNLCLRTLLRIKAVLSGIFTEAIRLDFRRGENPVLLAKMYSRVEEARETYAYSLDEVQDIVRLLPQPAATIFAVAAYTGLRQGEIEGLRWEDYTNGELRVSRSIWRGKESAPKTRKSRAPVPVITPLQVLLDAHQRRAHIQEGSIFQTVPGRPASLPNVVKNQILPALDRCMHCGRMKTDHVSEHVFEQDLNLPKWHGWHAARRGLASILYRLGVPATHIQAILRHASVKTTENHYIKSNNNDKISTMRRLEEELDRITKSSNVGQGSSI